MNRIQELAGKALKARMQRQSQASSDRPFGVRLVEARQKLGWSRTELSRQCGMTPSGVAKIEEQRTTIDDTLARWKALVESVGGVFIVTFPGEE